MRRSFLALALLAGLSPAAAPTAALAGNQDFKLINKTGYQIDEVYVSRVSNRNWGQDVMGSDSLAANESVNITFNAPDNACNWDLKVKYNDGDTSEWSNINLCNVNSITLYWDRKNGQTRAVTN